MDTHSARPVYLDLLHIRLPIMAVTSIMHRVTGVLLSLSVPFLVYLLDRSLSGPEGYRRVVALWDNFAVRVIAVLLLWALLHHLFAGIRHLLLDLHLGTKLQQARASAWTVNAAGLAVLVIAAVLLLP
jgi:succinate dehydrogenase / fumarate reductase cytochrome b subunit